MKTILTNSNLSNFLLFSLLLLFITGCEKEVSTLELNVKNASATKNQNAGPFIFEGRVYDIAATPDGSIMVTVNSGESRSIQLIKNGTIETMANIDSETDIQGIAVIGTGNAFATTGGTDKALNGELYRFSNGNARVVADLAEFERNVDPDAFEGLMWKDQECEASPIYTAGPQNNPYNLAALSGSEVLVADAAGNSILRANDEGEVDWFAILPPPTNDDGEWIELGNIGDITCYAQPVPTAVAVGPDGYVYVGELTGAFVDGIPVNRSRVWKIPADANNVACMTDGSGDCELLIPGLTSVIDLAVGPDGYLYVVEFDESSWLAAYGVPASGGTISKYNLNGEFVEIVASELSFPSAITFDKKGNLWLLENNNVPAVPGLGETLPPTVRMLDL